MVEDALLACIDSILCFWRDLFFCTVVFRGFNVWHVEMFGLVKLSDKECDNIDNTNVFLSAL